MLDKQAELALITLTARGRELFERVVPAHLANERRLLSGLTEPEQQVLASLLRKLLVEFEGSRARRLGHGSAFYLQDAYTAEGPYSLWFRYAAHRSGLRIIGSATWNPSSRKAARR